MLVAWGRVTAFTQTGEFILVGCALRFQLRYRERRFPA